MTLLSVENNKKGRIRNFRLKTAAKQPQNSRRNERRFFAQENIAMRSIKLTVVLLLMLAGLSCSRMKTVNPNEFFTLKPGETVRVGTAEIKVKMIEAVNPPPGSTASPLCRLEITYKAKTEEKALEADAFASYDQWNLRVERANPAMDVTKTSCMLVVRKTFDM
jgi:hypothetical protein